MARPGQNISILIGCIVLALILWGYVTLTRYYEDDIDVPLTVIPPPNQALLSSVPHSITARVGGSGLEIINLQYIARNARCEIDLGKVRSESASMYNIEREDVIRGMSVSGSVRILSVTPTAMTLTTGDVFVREVPVRLESNITTRDGFVVVGAPKLEPSTVEVRGTKSVIEAITSWPTERLALADLRESTTATVALSDSLRTLLNFVPATIQVKIDVQQAAERTMHGVQVRIVSDDPTIRAEPSLVTVVVEGGAERLADLAAGELDVTVAGTQLGPVKPTVTTPEGVKVIAIQPPVVRVARRLP